MERGRVGRDARLGDEEFARHDRVDVVVGGRARGGGGAAGFGVGVGDFVDEGEGGDVVGGEVWGGGGRGGGFFFAGEGAKELAEGVPLEVGYCGVPLGSGVWSGWLRWVGSEVAVVFGC